MRNELVISLPGYLDIFVVIFLLVGVHGQDLIDWINYMYIVHTK